MTRNFDLRNRICPTPDLCCGRATHNMRCSITSLREARDSISWQWCEGSVRETSFGHCEEWSDVYKESSRSHAGIMLRTHAICSTTRMRSRLRY